ncbi:MAG TPA: NADH-quinone oxidoreductase subunit NuoG [Ktedonobacterales bacterium]|nr:NADH-quinone oxidoreductase subunit NuoG [Ktedonobacterales bacterium]
MPEETPQLISLTIDGRPVSVPPGTVVWKAAQLAGIEVPIYCYHPKMPPLGACRMCFVEIEKVPKPPQTACTTLCTEGMVVHTDTPLVKKARQGTLEFLLINHPLDCPICDKGGECDLQDFTLRHGPGGSRFDLTKRHFVKPIPVSDDIFLDRERCIACQRCVRFSQEVAMDEQGLIMVDRGYKIEVSTTPGESFNSIFSGNTVEMCPVGALTARNYRFRTRPWELRKTPSVCANCSVGCNVRVDVRVDRILRLMSQTNDSIDDGWLCNRGRWGFDYVNSPERLRAPLVRKNGQLEEATWDEALDLVATKLQEIAKRDGPHAVGGIGSTHTTNEESYLFQKLFRAAIGTNNVDHHHGLFPQTEAGQLPWAWTDSIAGLDKASHIVLFAADPYERQPIIDLRIKKALRAGAKIYVVANKPTRLDRLATLRLEYQPGQLDAVVRGLLNVVLTENLARGPYVEQHPEFLNSLQTPTGAAEHAARIAGVDAEALRALAREIAGAKGAVLLYDERAARDEEAPALAADLLNLTLATGNVGRPGAGVGPLFEDNNSLGARDMGVLPNSLPGYADLENAALRSLLRQVWGISAPKKPGLSYEEMLGGGVKALYVIGADPAHHLPSPDALKGLEFLVVQSLSLNETAKYADVVLPGQSFAEKEGTFTNTERCVQAVRQAMRPLAGPLPDWQILTELGRRMNQDWHYASPREILAEIARVVPIYSGLNWDVVSKSQGIRWPALPENVAEGGSTYLALDLFNNGLPQTQEVAETVTASD